MALPRPSRRATRKLGAQEADEPLICAECGREPREDENAADEWRAYRDVSDESPVFCPQCAERASSAWSPSKGVRCDGDARAGPRCVRL
jgi:hypothetical protein